MDGKVTSNNNNAKSITDKDFDSDELNSSNEADETIVAAQSMKTNDEVSKMVEEVSASIAKLTTKKSRLSGAQRRRIAKMNRKMKTQKADTKEKVPQDVTEEKVLSTPTSSDVGKRIRSPEEQNIVEAKKKKKCSPSTSSSAPGKSSTSQKGSNTETKLARKDEPETTTAQAVAKVKSSSNVKAPSLTSMKRKLDVKPGKEHPISYAKVAKRSAMDELCYAVIDQSNPTGKIPVAQRQCLEEAINMGVMQYVLEADDDATAIRIDSCRFSMDVLMLQLASKNCIGVLRKLVEGISAPWEGAKLALVNKAEIPSLTKTSFFVKGWGGKNTTEQILKILGKQNKGLAVEKWEIFHREESPDGTLIIVGIDQDSMDHLKKSKGKAFFITTAVYFKVGKNTIGWEKSNAKHSDGVDEMAVETEVGATNDTTANSKEGEPAMTNSQEEKLLAES